MGMPQFLTSRSEAGEAWDLWLEFSLVGLSPLLVGSDDNFEKLVCPDSEKAMAARSSILAWKNPMDRGSR